MHLSNLNKSLFSLSIAFAFTACTDNSQNPNESECDSHAENQLGGGKYCNSQCVVDLFKQLAPIYRPSGEEKAIRDRLLELAQSANTQLWKGALEISEPDAIGNFVIRVPATATYAKQALPPVALQAHMDMVLAATDVAPGGDLKAYFRANPVTLEEVDGKLQSVGQKTTIGADDTIGCALMLRYALDPTIPHPPLELVFTVHEEIGLKGAQEFDVAKLPLRAPVMISLDGDDSGKLIYGSQGSMRRSVTGALPTTTMPASKLVKVTVSKLLGGHSGLDIHKQRLNAVIALADVAKTVLNDSRLGVVGAVAGDLAGLNKIPSSLELTLALPAGVAVAQFQRAVEARVKALVDSHAGETMNTNVTTTVAELPLPAEPITVLEPQAATRLISTVLAVELQTPPLNGVISQNPQFPNAVNTSSNLGFLDLKLDPMTPNQRVTTLGFMARSFSATELKSTTDSLISHLKGAFDVQAQLTVKEITGYNPWFSDPSSWLIKTGVELEVKGQRPFRLAAVQPVGLEPSYFLAKFPDIQIVGMGASIVDFHTVRENVAIQSIHDIASTLDAFLQRLPAVPEFAHAKPRS